MSGWTAQELERVGEAGELQISSRRKDGSLRKFVTIWVVRADDALYVRSAYGPENGWYVRALASGSGRVRAGGVERDVAFEQPGDDVKGAVDAAYESKYASSPPKIVATVVGPTAGQTTIRLVPRPTE